MNQVSKIPYSLANEGYQKKHEYGEFRYDLCIFFLFSIIKRIEAKPV